MCSHPQVSCWKEIKEKLARIIFQESQIVKQIQWTWNLVTLEFYIHRNCIIMFILNQNL